MSGITNEKNSQDTIENINSEIDKKMEFQNAVTTFYMLKSEYDEQIQEIKRKIAKKKGLSKKEKRDEFKKIKPICVNCRRKVGSIFEIKYNVETDSRIAKALCGDKLNRCPLNIEINLGKIKSLAEEVKEVQDEMNDLKKQIVIIKNDLLFGYITTDKAVEDFESLKNELSSSTELYEILLVSYISVYDSPEKAEEIKKLELDIYNDIKSIKQYIHDFNREKNLEFVQDAVTLLVSQLTPKVKELRNLKYPIMNVDTSDKQCKLIQKPLDYSRTENDAAFTEHGIVDFDVGVDTQIKRKKRQDKSNDKDKSSSEVVLSPHSPLAPPPPSS